MDSNFISDKFVVKVGKLYVTRPRTTITKSLGLTDDVNDERIIINRVIAKQICELTGGKLYHISLIRK